LTVPEVRRVVLAAGEDPAKQAFLLRWSRWRRAHQAGAQRCHVTRRAREQETSVPATPAPRRAGDLAQEILTDAEWARVQPLLPPLKPAVGRPRHDDRTVLTGILWVLRTPAPWREMPPAYGKANTAFVRYRHWCRQGLWQRIIDVLGPAAAPPAPRARAPTSQVSL
jgi:hypothetical protein